MLVKWTPGDLASLLAAQEKGCPPRSYTSHICMDLLPDAPGMPGTFSPPWRVSDMHHDTCMTHVPWFMAESLTSGFLWSRWREKRSKHSRRMHNPQFCVSGKSPISLIKVSTNKGPKMDAFVLPCKEIHSLVILPILILCLQLDKWLATELPAYIYTFNWYIYICVCIYMYTHTYTHIHMY